MTVTQTTESGLLRDIQDPGDVYGLWIGGRLSILAELCIRSFQYHGFCFKLFTYGSVENVPDGTTILDAGEVLPVEDAFVHKTGSLAPASDWFRYRFLFRHGGTWVDMDLVCLRPFRIGRLPWFAEEGGGIIAIGVLAFPAGHELLAEMESFAADPARITPWDTPAQAKAKADLAKSVPEVAERRSTVHWGAAGPGEFSRAVDHFGLRKHAARPVTVYPVHYGVWRHLFDGTLRLDSKTFADSVAIHLWGELTRREPDALTHLSPGSVVGELMRMHGLPLDRLPAGPSLAAGPDQRILVGVCSARAHHERRQAVRETWMSRPAPQTTVRFFVGHGEGQIEDDCGDMVEVFARDDYDHLPEKVRAFFSSALQSDFDWLFKCDDDTYVDLSRLREVAFADYDLVGNEFVESRGAPSGGAGYLLKRQLVERLVGDDRFPATGSEDLLVGEAARRFGASLVGTRRLCWDTSRYPQSDNDVITSHWCSPERLRVIHEVRYKSATEIVVNHRYWSDRMKLFADGTFTRCSTPCEGTWIDDRDGVIRLQWSTWPEEVLVPEQSEGNTSTRRYRCAPTTVECVIIELGGGLGNQMFQYAHGLALAREIGATLKIGFADFGRAFALHHFGIALDSDLPRDHEVIRYDGDFVESNLWPTLKQIRETRSRCVKIAGYFQNEGFFRPVADEVRRRFMSAVMCSEGISERNLVGIHVRRGDFLSNDLHDVCRPKYYRDAIRIMRSLITDPRFIVVSDDPDGCHGIFLGEPDVDVVAISDELTSLKTLCSCQAHILSNSTFGWWGAWLPAVGPVIAPSRFLAGRPWNICPDRWIQVPSEGVGDTSWDRG